MAVMDRPAVELKGLSSARRDYEALPSAPVPDDLCLNLVGAESFEMEAISNLDAFFTRVYRYYAEKGFVVMVVTRVLNIFALAFIAAFSGMLMLAVDWAGLHNPCIVERKCDILEVAFHRHPLWDHPSWWTASVTAYLALLGVYFLWSMIHLVEDLRDATEIRHFYRNRLGISDRLMATMTWPEVLQRIVLLQQHIRLCIVRDLTAHDICARIMRRENFLIGMLNKGVLKLGLPFPGLRCRIMLTKLMEWNLRYCLLDAMFDRNFLIKHEFKHKPGMLARRFRAVALMNLVVSPFLMAFLVIYFFMRNAEKFYHHPSWSPYAKWRMREFNEMEHFLTHRLAASREGANEYISQFPTPVVRQVARFTAFVSGSFAALILFLAAVNDILMERHLGGHNLVVWAACLGVLLAVSRALLGETTPVFDPEDAMAKVVRHTHYMPRHWRGRAHSREVQEQFQGMFCFKALLFIEELASVFMAPFVLAVSLPKSADSITQFIRENSVHVSGLGDVCSLAQFDMDKHGSPRYGGPRNVHRDRRSKQGKLEKSLVSFASTYRFWEPATDTQTRFLQGLLSHSLAHRMGSNSGGVTHQAGGSFTQDWSRMSNAGLGGEAALLSSRSSLHRAHRHGWGWQQSSAPANPHDDELSLGSNTAVSAAVLAQGMVRVQDSVASSQTALQLLYHSCDDVSSVQRSRFSSCLADAEARSEGGQLWFSASSNRRPLLDASGLMGSLSTASGMASFASAGTSTGAGPTPPHRDAPEACSGTASGPPV